MTKKEAFIKWVESCKTHVEKTAENEEYLDMAFEYFEMFKSSSEVVDKPKFTDNGARILKYMQENKELHNNMFKAKDIGEGLNITSRAAGGAMRKLVSDGYLEKIVSEPVVIYAITSLGMAEVIE